MTKAIEKLISNPALAATISLNARKQVEAFDWDIVKHQVAEAFKIRIILLTIFMVLLSNNMD